MLGIGERIRQVRLNFNKTQRELGEAIGVSAVAISHYERGDVVPPTQRLKDMATFFNINVSYLIGDGDKLFEPGIKYHAAKKVPLIEASLATNLPEHIIPYAKEYIEVPIPYTNKDTFAVEVVSNGTKLIVVAERGNKRLPFFLCNIDSQLTLCSKDSLPKNRKNIITGVLHFI